MKKRTKQTIRTVQTALTNKTSNLYNASITSFPKRSLFNSSNTPTTTTHKSITKYFNQNSVFYYLSNSAQKLPKSNLFLYSALFASAASLFSYFSYSSLNLSSLISLPTFSCSTHHPQKFDLSQKVIDNPADPSYPINVVTLHVRSDASSFDFQFRFPAWLQIFASGYTRWSITGKHPRTKEPYSFTLEEEELDREYTLSGLLENTRKFRPLGWGMEVNRSKVDNMDVVKVVQVSARRDYVITDVYVKLSDKLWLRATYSTTSNDVEDDYEDEEVEGKAIDTHLKKERDVYEQIIASFKFRKVNYDGTRVK